MAKSVPPKDVEMNQVETRFDPVSAALKQLHVAVVAVQVPEDFLRTLDEIDAKIAARKQIQ